MKSLSCAPFGNGVDLLIFVILVILPSCTFPSGGAFAAGCGFVRGLPGPRLTVTFWSTGLNCVPSGCSPSGGDGIIGDGLGPSLIDEPDNGLTLGVLNNGDDDLGSSSKSAIPNNSFAVPFGASC